VSEPSSTPPPTPTEEVSPEPQTPEPEVATPRTPNPQTPSPQAPAPPPTQLGTDNSGFIPGRTSAPGQTADESTRLRQPLHPPRPGLMRR
jgi:hypothetical protein